MKVKPTDAVMTKLKEKRMIMSYIDSVLSEYNLDLNKELDKVEKYYGTNKACEDFAFLAGMILNTGKADSLDCDVFIYNMLLQQKADVGKDTMKKVWRETCKNSYDLFVENGRLEHENKKAVAHSEIQTKEIARLQDALRKTSTENDDVKLLLSDERRKNKDLRIQSDCATKDNLELMEEIDRVEKDNEALKRTIKLVS